MARVNTVEKAQKSQGNCGKCQKEIAKGDSYRWWKPRYGSKQVRCMLRSCAPRQSDLTSSDKLSRAYAAGESVEDAIEAFRADHDFESLKSAVSDAAEQLREVAEEYREASSNVESGMNGNRMPICDEMEEKADSLESQADDMESAVDEFEEREEVDDLTDEQVVDLIEEENGDEGGFDGYAEERVRDQTAGFGDLPEGERTELVENMKKELVEEKRAQLKEDEQQAVEDWVEEVASAVEQYTSIEVG